MNTYAAFFKVFFCIGLFFLMFMYGAFLGHKKIFPYEELREIRWYLFPDSKVEKKLSNRLAIFEEFSPDVDFVFVGDSITHSGMWSEFFPDISVANRGVTGDTTADVKARLSTIFATNPEYAFIMLGLNDIYKYVSAERIVSNYADIVEALQQNNIQVVIQSTIQCLQVYCEDLVGEVNRLNELLKYYAGNNGVTFLNLNELSSIDGLDESLTSDGIHLNAKGYRVWVDILSSKINKLSSDAFDG